MQDTKRILCLFGGFGASAVMLTLAQAPIGWWPLAWVAYVPFIVACYQATIVARHSSPVARTTGHEPRGTSDRIWTLYLAAYVVGAGYWLGNLYWIGFVTVAGWISFCLYTAGLWPILAWCLRWCRTKQIPLVIAVPILVVGIERTQGILLGGFNWDYLAHSQYANTSLIQIADIFGAGGVSFLVAMVNGVVAEIIFSIRDKTCGLPRLRHSRAGKHTLQGILVATAVVGAIAYGTWRIEQSDKYITTGPMIGAVQTNVAQSVKQSFAAEGQILEELISESNQCIPAGVKFIAWPETMVQAILEPQVQRLLEDTHTYKVFDKTIRQEALKGAYILVGGYGGTPRVDENDFDIRMAQKFNTAFLYKPDGNQSPQKYYKIHLVPFGEYIPFTDVPLIHNLLLKMTPYDFDYTLDAGTEYTVFEMQPGQYKFGVMICYEDAVPLIARKFTLNEKGSKRINWLVNISNDGWFVRFKNDKVMPSTELAQHTIVCAFRAVENRLAILRSVNTGISCMIDSLGRVRDGYAAGNLPKNAFDRRGVGGWFADSVPIDSRITFFSKHGQWLDLSCQLCLAGMIIMQLIERFVKKRARKKEESE
jgi:apolipoprotein N-acyltransferase